MLNSTSTFIKASPAFTGPAVATVAACAMEIAGLLKSHGFDVRSVAEAVESIGPEIIAATSGAPGTLIVLAIDGRGRRAFATVSADDATLATYAATFATFMAGHWVAGLAVAALSVRGLTTALVFLRGALIRTGIGALIVGAGELVYQFSQLVARVGGVGEAFRLLGELAKEVWSRIGLSLNAAFANMAAGWEGLKAAGLSALEGTITGVVSFGDRTAAIFQGGAVEKQPKS